jgi:hypothetical protein
VESINKNYDVDGKTILDETIKIKFDFHDENEFHCWVKSIDDGCPWNFTIAQLAANGKLIVEQDTWRCAWRYYGHMEFLSPKDFRGIKSITTITPNLSPFIKNILLISVEGLLWGKFPVPDELKQIKIKSAFFYDEDIGCASTEDGKLHIWKSYSTNFERIQHGLPNTKIKQIYPHILRYVVILTEVGNVFQWWSPEYNLEDVLIGEDCIKIRFGGVWQEHIVLLTRKGNVYVSYGRKIQIDKKEKIKNVYANQLLILTQSEEDKIRVWDFCGHKDTNETREIEEYSKDKEIMKIFEFDDVFVITFTDFAQFVIGKKNIF